MPAVEETKYLRWVRFEKPLSVKMDGVGYFTINAYMNDGIYNQALLDSMPAVEETKYLRWVRFEKPLSVKMDGKKKLGVVELPED